LIRFHGSFSFLLTKQVMFKRQGVAAEFIMADVIKRHG
jgi:hypothetical protein